MTRPTKNEKPPPVQPLCPICNGVLDLDGLCKGNARCYEACTHEQNMACMEVVKLVLGGKLADCEGQERIREILRREVPF